MDKNMIDALTTLGLSAEQIANIKQLQASLPAIACWQKICATIPLVNTNFLLLNSLYCLIFPDWEKTPAPAWIPSEKLRNATNITRSIKQLGLEDYEAFLRWSYQDYEIFWQYVCEQLNINFIKPYTKIIDISAGIEHPQWFPGALMNISQSCFKHDPNAIAIIYQPEHGSISELTYGQLEALSNRVANSLVSLNFKSGDAIAIDMPMTPECVAIYLGIIKAGCAAISIADSFAPEEIATRLRIANAKAIFTQDFITRNNKPLPLYNKVIAANAPLAIVLTEKNSLTINLRASDLTWEQFLVENNQFNVIACQPHAAINILFSSGTTGDPKAIPWNHTTPIRCASDAYFHHDVKPGDIFAWPTNLGWMMGPWLVFASLINGGTIALYGGAPTTKSFGEFIQNAKVNILGLVPSIVKSWRATACMEGLNWSTIKLFSSSGECSNVEDMLYLMSLAGNKPVIEYCGGTEIGGAYISGTLVQPAAPAAFTTATLGTHFIMLDERGHPTESGEVAIISPSIGLSLTLLNKDHHEVYFANMPTLTGQLLRRHGDHIQHFANGFYRALGRVDDTMNLGGIKISSAEIERTLLQSNCINEAAAVAVTPMGGGPSQLVIYIVSKADNRIELTELKPQLQKLLNEHLNPLFKIHEVVYINELPRTASNKIMRRVLRKQYETARKP